MADKKYYWLRLKRNFFKRHDIRIIEAMPNGKDYVLFYLKLLVESVDHEGLLRFSETIPYNEEMLSTVTDTNVDIVRSALKIFKELEMVEVLDDKTLYMKEVETMIGSATQDEYTRESARLRKQRQREREKLNDVTVTLLSQDSCVTCHGEIEKEIEKEIDINTLSGKPEPFSYPYAKIVEYLNEKAGTNYKATGNKTRTLIKARFNDGFTLEDFYKVIDNKVADWQGTDMAQYLRPETLFGTKFEGYLNSKPTAKKKSNGAGNFGQYQQRDIDFDALNKRVFGK